MIFVFLIHVIRVVFGLVWEIKIFAAVNIPEEPSHFVEIHIILGGRGVVWLRYDRPGKEVPGKEVPGNDRPGKELPGKELPGKDLPGKDLPGYERLGYILRVGHSTRCARLTEASPTLASGCYTRPCRMLHCIRKRRCIRSSDILDYR